MAAFSEEFLNKDGFEADVATFYCYGYEKSGYDTNVSQAVQNIFTDQKDYHKCSLCVIVCCISSISSITVKKVDY